MAKEIGIDLGTTNVVIHLKGRGVVLNEPSVIAVDRYTQEIVAVGRDAYDLIGRTGNAYEIVYPLERGVIADYERTEALLVMFFQRIYRPGFFSKPNVLVSRPSVISEVEERALIEAVERAGAGRVFMDIEPKVAGIGAGISLDSPEGHMVIDIGGGTTDIAIISNGSVVVSETLPLAGRDMDEAVCDYFRKQRKLLLGERSAEQLKIQIASAIEVPESEVVTATVKGRNLLTGLPMSINATSNDLYNAILPIIDKIACNAKMLIEEVDPELAGDIMERGIILTGGGALIRSLDDYLSNELEVSVIASDQPMQCVAIGTGVMLDTIGTNKLMRRNPSPIQRLKQTIQSSFRRIVK